MTDFAQRCGDLFSAEGPLAAAIPGFSVRVEQVAMAELVAESLSERRKTVIEAGTGVGKTFAYLAPALFAKKRIVVSTGTRTLQDQLFSRDLPIISGALGRPARVAILKGRANYLCLHRLELAEREAAVSRRRAQIASINLIRRWSHTTARGDIAELSSFSEADPIWAAVTSTRENCLGVDCPVFQRCHLVKARREAQAADVVIVNHHLLMADLLLKERGFGDLLPGADAIVIDEAHQLSEVAEQFLGFVISARQFQNLCRDLTIELQTQRLASETIAESMSALQRSLAECGGALSGGSSEARLWSDAFVEALTTVREALSSIAKELDSYAERSAALVAVSERAQEYVHRIGILVGRDEDEYEATGVRWAETSHHGFSVHYAPIDVAEQMGALIDAHEVSWIFTSATLAVAGDFTHFLRRVGVTGATTHCFGSPFDYQRQAMLYLPRALDAPTSMRHTQQFIDAVIPLLKASGGRAFVLFTSHRALQASAKYLDGVWGDAPPYPLLVQGTAPRDQLLQRFRDAGNAVLLGTGSFWEGVDVKGPALVIVAIEKLPFAVPDEPVMKARLAAIERAGGNPFFDEQVPHAVIALKQGVGRLIRDTADFGLVVLCDRRVLTKPYGRIFLDSLPSMRRTEDLETAACFLREKFADAGIDSQCSEPRISSPLISAL